jgi:DNA-binding PucR family transcriptional regulator
MATLADVHVSALMLDLGDMTMARDDEITGHLALLQAYDAQHNGSLVETLECWLDAFGDVAAAAAAAFVHTNTFRYRLKRLEQISGIDLDSPEDRFAAMLQLRLIRSRPETR